MEQAQQTNTTETKGRPITEGQPVAEGKPLTDGRRITVVVDVLGGDNAPKVVCEGVRAFVQNEQGVNIVLTGPVDVVQPLADEYPDRIEAVATTEFIGMDEHPATAVKQKKDSSIVVACRLVKEGRADAFFSAGNTGACMAAATLILGRLKGVQRPAILTVVPAPTGPLAFLDIGANADVKPEYLLQFAQMGRAYAMSVLHVPAPRIGLLNIGSEESKGSAFAQEVYALLAARLEGFAGNAEGNDFFAGTFDCIVTDGFTGNVVLKAMEGAVSVLFREIKGALMSSFTAKLGAALVKGKLMELKELMSADEYGGAPLLGLKNIVIIGHGSSNVKAIANGIRVSAEAVRVQLPLLIEKAVVNSAPNADGSASVSDTSFVPNADGSVSNTSSATATAIGNTTAKATAIATGNTTASHNVGERS